MSFFLTSSPEFSVVGNQVASGAVAVAAISLLVLINVPFTRAAVMQAVIEIDGGREDLMRTVLQAIEKPTDVRKNLSGTSMNGVDGGKMASSAAERYATFSHLFAAALILGRSFSIQGNISDKTLSPDSTVQFHFQAETVGRIKPSHSNRVIRKSSTKFNDNNNGDSDGHKETECTHEHEEDQEDWFMDLSSTNGRGGILRPIVQTIEPYILTLLNIIFHGIMASIVTKIMDSANMTGDIRLE